jgi:hypothetical protein
MCYKLFLIIFLILLIIILSIKILNLNENFKNNNSEFKIVMFLTSGLNEEAENCINTLKKQKLDNKLIVTALDDEAYSHINNLGVNTKLKKTNLKKEANFGTKDFFEITINKLEIIEESLKKYKCTILYTDTDIVFLKDISEDVQKFDNSNFDIIFQNDTPKFEKNDKHNMCSGFFAIKYNEKGLNCVKYAIKLMKDNLENRKWDNGGGADQKAMNIAIKTNNCNVDTFDLMDYPNGSRYFNYNHKFKNYTPKIIHNNYIIGTKNKIERFKKFNLWFVSKPKLYGTKYGGFFLPSNIKPKKKQI